MKIAVFVCDCGTNIASVVDVPDVVSYASSLPDVVLAEEGKWICSVDYLDRIKELIDEHSIEKVVVACCTPRTHERIFREALKEAGLNPNLLEFCSIREHSSWVHKREPGEATEKAKDLVRMAVAKARLLVPAEPIQIPVGGRCLVAGGGIAGMSAAAALAENGFEVILIERQDRLGGLLNELSILAPDNRPATEVLEPMLENVNNNELIDVRTDTELQEAEGYVGNFKVTLDTKGNEIEEDIATIILATGMKEIPPNGVCGYGKHKNVVTQLQFEKMLKENKLDGISKIAIITCVNSRNETRGCCGVGCMAALKWINKVKDIKPDSEVYLFYRDIIIPGIESGYYEQTQPKADGIIRFNLRASEERSAGGLPEVVESEDGGLSVTALDMLLNEDVTVDVDMVVLVAPFSGDSSAEKLKDLLRVGIGPDNFYQEAHVKLRPVDFATDGIYLAGCARSPKSVPESIEEALGTAMRASIPMKRGYSESDGLVAIIDAENCIDCELCANACSFGALEAISSAESSKSAQSVIEALCKGCGNCVAGCPEHTITMTNYTDEQLEAQVEAALEITEVKKPIAFCCHWCALGAADLAGVSRLQYPSDIRIIRVMCSGRVDPAMVLKSFKSGAPGVLVAGCEVPTCHYVSGNIYAGYRMELVKLLMGYAGLEEKRLGVEWMSAAQGDKFAKVMQEFTQFIKKQVTISEKRLEGLEMEAAVAVADSERLRLLVGKLPDMEAEGNEYGEKLTRFELNRILRSAAENEFDVQKILILLKRKAMSVNDLAVEAKVSRPKVFRIVLSLIKDNRVKRVKVDGTTPYYAVKEPSSEEVSQKDTKRMEGGVPHTAA